MLLASVVTASRVVASSYSPKLRGIAMVDTRQVLPQQEIQEWKLRLGFLLRSHVLWSYS
jgi:hypothetical protein